MTLDFLWAMPLGFRLHREFECAGHEEIPVAVSRERELRLPSECVGLRTIGIITSALSCAIAATGFYRVYRTTGEISQEMIGACVLALVFLLLWIFRFSADWVRIPADEYAQRLVEAIDTMSAKAAAAKK
jgi:hypothetical protein